MEWLCHVTQAQWIHHLSTLHISVASSIFWSPNDYMCIWGSTCSGTATHCTYMYGANHQSPDWGAVQMYSYTCINRGVAIGAGTQEASTAGAVPRQASLHTQSRGSSWSSSLSTVCVGRRGSHSGTVRVGSQEWVWQWFNVFAVGHVGMWSLVLP